MSENHYRLDLTEREKDAVLTIAVSTWVLFEQFGKGPDVLLGLFGKLRALEPIGTGGTTTTEGA